ncbi:MAG: hypothetical protein ACI84C_000664 [Flavobacteriales bacterium]|jgi:hypothetical protein
METGATKANAEFRDRTYTLEQSKDSHLAVLVDRDAISYSVTEISTGTVRALSRFSGKGNPLESQWKESLEFVEDFQQEYQSANIAVNSVPFAMVPESLNSNEHDAKLFELNNGYQGANLLSQLVPDSKIRVVCDLPAGFNEEFHRKQPYATMSSTAALMMQSILKRHRFSKGYTIYVVAGDSYFDCYMLKDNALVLYNWFATQSVNDVLYHVLNIASQFDFDPSLVPVNVTGMLDVQDKLYALLKEYLPKVNMIYSLDHVKLSLGITGVSKQHFSSLFNQFACA